MILLKPEISVVFPTYNRPGELFRTLKLLSENITVPYEVLIMDNSHEPLKHSFKKNERYFFSGENLGAAARNIGIRNANASYILMLDDDSHPFPGSVEKALRRLKNSSPETAGITGLILRPNGGRENPPLLPTAFHGCGFLSKTETLLKLGTDFYPDDFCFYGEEYWSTLLLYRAGYSFEFLEDFKICHRMSASGRDVGRILYQLTLNNRRTWKSFVPDIFLEKITYDTERRYELISTKEGVRESFLKAIGEEIEVKTYGEKMSVERFEKFSMISNFRELFISGKLRSGTPVVLCGCGKFPSLWIDVLKSHGINDIVLSDLNGGLVGNKYREYEVLSPDEAEKMMGKGFHAVCGHSSRTDTDTWKSLLRGKAYNITDLLKEVPDEKSA